MTSIRRTLQVWLVVTLTLLLGASGLALSLRLRRLVVDQFDAGLEARAKLLAALVHVEVGKGLHTEFHEVWLPQYQPGPEAEYFALLDGQGARFETSLSLAKAELATAAPGGTGARTWDFPLPDGRSGRALALVFRPHIEPGRNAPGEAAQLSSVVMTLVAARGRASLDAELRDMSVALVVLGLGLLLGVPLVVAGVVRRGLRPLDGLADRVKAIDAPRLELGLSADTMPSELQPIVGRLSDLLARLRASFERERRFSADVAHELRTPLAEMRTIAEVSLAEVEPGSEEGAALRDLRAAALQMERIVVTLLSLARCEQGRQLVQLEIVELRQALAQAWTPLEETARGRSLRVEIDPGAPVHVRTDPTLLASILGNLLSNAVAYTPDEGSIAVRATRVPEGVELRIVNSQRSLGPTDLEHLFEPFWRKEQARSGGSHAGLGLALVAALSRLLRIELRATLPAPERFCIALTFPDETDTHLTRP